MKNKIDVFVKSTNHVILNEVRMKNLSQLSTRFFPDESGLPQNDSPGSFYETIKITASVVFLMLLLVIENVNARQWEMHQHITRETFDLLQMSFPGQLSEMESFVGNLDVNSFSNNLFIKKLNYQNNSGLKNHMQTDYYSTNASINGIGKNWIYNINYLIPAKDKSANDEFDHYLYRFDIGINNTYLLSSDILKEGYSGFGVFIEPYIGKYISFKFEMNRWIISSLKEDLYYTPFHKTSLWKRYYLLKLNIYPWNQVIFAQFGIIGQSKNAKYSGGIRRGGFNYGFGCHLFSFKKFSFSLTIDENILGRIGLVDGEIWDANKEISFGVSYSIKGIRRIKK